MRELKGTLFEFFRQDDDSSESKKNEEQVVEIVGNLYRALELGNVEDFQAQLSDDVELTIVGPESVPFTGSAKGKEEVVAFASKNFSMLVEQHAKINNLLAQGTCVAVFGEETGKFADSRAYHMEWVHHFKVIDGKVSSIRQVFDTASVQSASRNDASNSVF